MLENAGPRNWVEYYQPASKLRTLTGSRERRGREKERERGGGLQIDVLLDPREKPCRRDVACVKSEMQ